MESRISRDSWEVTSVKYSWVEPSEIGLKLGFIPDGKGKDGDQDQGMIRTEERRPSVIVYRKTGEE